MLELRATVLCSTPTYAIRLAEAAQAAGIDLAASDIRITVHAGEPGASVPATRDLIERAFGARCFDHTGMTELGPTGVSCAARDGVHLIESEFVFEVRDDAGTVHSLPETGTISGELVATNLGRWGSPLIRYRTGDRVEVTRQQCECGSPFAKMLGGIRGRVDDMVTVGGVGAGVDGEAPVDGDAPVDGPTSGETLGEGDTAACATIVPNPPARPIPAATAILAIEPRNHPRLFIA